MTVSGTNDRWLQKGVAIPLIYEKMEPLLMWGKHLMTIPETEESFPFLYDDTGKSGDTKKKLPPRQTRPGAFPEIDRSVRSSSSAAMESHGFAMRIPYKVIQRAAQGKAEIMECYERAGYWMAEYINTNILITLLAGATAATSAVTDVWSAGTATPIKDLKHWHKDMRREGYPFRQTDAFVDEENWYELADHVDFFDADHESKKQIYGITDIAADTIYIPSAKQTIHLVMNDSDLGGLTHGTLLGLDKNNKAAELHYFNDPNFATAKVRYETMVGDKKTVQTVPNMGIHFRQRQDDENLDTILEFWYENKVVVTKPYGLLKATGL
jgi:hypothetical protein